MDSKICLLLLGITMFMLCEETQAQRPADWDCPEEEVACNGQTIEAAKDKVRMKIK